MTLIQQLELLICKVKEYYVHGNEYEKKAFVEMLNQLEEIRMNAVKKAAGGGGHL